MVIRSAEAPVQPLPKRPPAVDETVAVTAGKTPRGADPVPGATSAPRRSSPAAPDLSPAPDPSKTTESAKALDCEPIAGALDRLRRAYNAGALDSLMALYRPDAQENETRGHSGIRQLYVDWFDQTSDRRIAFSGVRIRPEGKGRCAVRAGFSVSYRDARGQRVDRTGSTVILFDGRGADARILRVSY